MSDDQMTSHSGDLSKIVGRLSADDVNAGDLASLDSLIADLLRDAPDSDLAAFLATTVEHLRNHRDVSWVASYTAANLPPDHPLHGRVHGPAAPAHK